MSNNVQTIGFAAVLAIVLSITVGCDDKKQMIEYVPYVITHDGVTEDLSKLQDPLHIATMAKVLVEYDHEFQYRNGKLYITSDLAENREMLANLANKALVPSRSASGDSQSEE